MHGPNSITNCSILLAWRWRQYEQSKRRGPEVIFIRLLYPEYEGSTNSRNVVDYSVTTRRNNPYFHLAVTCKLRGRSPRANYLIQLQTALFCWRLHLALQLKVCNESCRSIAEPPAIVIGFGEMFLTCSCCCCSRMCQDVCYTVTVIVTRRPAGRPAGGPLTERYLMQSSSSFRAAVGLLNKWS